MALYTTYKLLPEVTLTQFIGTYMRHQALIDWAIFVIYYYPSIVYNDQL